MKSEDCSQKSKQNSLAPSARRSGSYSAPLACGPSRSGFGLRTLTPASSRERFSATATVLSVRILEHEAALHERLLVVERQPFEVCVALRVDKKLHAPELKHLIAGSWLRFKLELVSQPGAAAARHPQPQPSTDVVFPKQRPNLFHRQRAYLDHIASLLPFLNVNYPLLRRQARLR